MASDMEKCTENSAWVHIKLCKILLLSSGIDLKTTLFKFDSSPLIRVAKTAEVIYFIVFR